MTQVCSSNANTLWHTASNRVSPNIWENHLKCIKMFIKQYGRCWMIRKYNGRDYDVFAITKVTDEYFTVEFGENRKQQHVQPVRQWKNLDERSYLCNGEFSRVIQAYQGHDLEAFGGEVTTMSKFRDDDHEVKEENELKVVTVLRIGEFNLELTEEQQELLTKSPEGKRLLEDGETQTVSLNNLLKQGNMLWSLTEFPTKLPEVPKEDQCKYM